MQKLCIQVRGANTDVLYLFRIHWFENGFLQIASISSFSTSHSFATNESNRIISFSFISLFSPFHRFFLICLCLSIVVFVCNCEAQLYHSTSVHMYKYIMVLPYRMHFICSVFTSFCSYSFWSRLLFPCSVFSFNGTPSYQIRVRFLFHLILFQSTKQK